MLPALLALAVGLNDAVLIKLGLRHNHWMDGVIRGKYSVAFPSGEGHDGGVTKVKPSQNGPGAVMILGAKSNGPFGMFEEGQLKKTPYFDT